MVYGREMFKGSVRWFNDSTGYGYINSCDYDGEIMFHYRSLPSADYQSIAADESILFELVWARNGAQAVNIRSGASYDMRLSLIQEFKYKNLKEMLSDFRFLTDFEMSYWNLGHRFSPTLEWVIYQIINFGLHQKAHPDYRSPAFIKLLTRLDELEENFTAVRNRAEDAVGKLIGSGKNNRRAEQLKGRLRSLEPYKPKHYALQVFHKTYLEAREFIR